MTIDDFQRKLEGLRSEISALRSQTAELEKYRDFWQANWPIVKKLGIAGALLLSVGIVSTIVFGRRHTSRKSEELELRSLSYLFDEILKPENREARRSIYTKLPEDPKQASSTDWRTVHEVIYSFEKIAYLIDSKLLSQQHAVNVCYFPAVKAWYKLASYVRQERLDRGESMENARFGKYFESFAKICIDHWTSLGGKLPPEYY